MNSKKKLIKLIENCVDKSFVNGKIDLKKVNMFVKQFKALPKSQIIFALTQYLKGLKRVINNHTLVIESSIPLSKKELDQITSIFKKQHKIFQTNASINHKILGGIKIMIGDTIYDNSLSRKIKEVGVAITS